MKTYAVLVQKWGIYVKDWEFFIEQGGLTQEWGRNWLTVHAGGEKEAREQGEHLRGIAYPELKG